MSRMGCGKAACYHSYCSTFSSLLRTRRTGSVRFSKDETIVRDLVQPNDAGVVGTEEPEPLAGVLRAVVTVIVAVSEAAGLTVPEKKTDAMRTPDQTTLAPPLVIEAAGQRYKKTAQFLYLGGIIHENADVSLEIDRRIRIMQAGLKWFGPELYDRTTAPLSLKVRMQKAEVIETLLYGCVT